MEKKTDAHSPVAESLFFETEVTVPIQNIEIPAYLLYINQNKKRSAHILCTSLEAKSGGGFIDPLNYYPTYEGMKPNQRAKYLSWLASGRKDPQIEIGYVFLYFYGLEHRVIKDNKNIPEVLSELVRLYEIYGKSHSSFSSYSTNLISWIVGSSENIDLGPLKNKLAFLFDDDSDFPKSAIYKKLNPHCSENDLIFYSLISQLYTGQVVEDCNDVLRKLFLHKVKIRNISTNVTSSIKTFYYDPSCQATPRKSAKLKQYKAKDEPLLIRLIFECSEELEHYKEQLNTGNPLAEIYLPKELHTKDFSELRAKMNNLNPKLIQVSDLLALLNIKWEKPGIRYARALSKVMNNLDFRVEPDPHLTIKSYKETDYIAFEELNPEVQLISATNKYIHPAAILDLSMLIAMTNGGICELKSKFALENICKGFDLSKEIIQHMKLRIALYPHLTISAPTLIKKLLASHKEGDMKSIGKFLFSVAALDGRLDSDELKLLKRNFKTMGFDENFLEEMLSTSKLVVVSKATAPRIKGSAIPQMGDINSKLNEAALASAILETQEVSRLLHDVFKNDAEVIQESEEDQILEIPATALRSKDLPEKVVELVSFLLNKKNWECEEVEKKCRNLGLMYGSAMTQINNYYEHKHGQTLLDDDGVEIVVHAEILNKEDLSA